MNYLVLFIEGPFEIQTYFLKLGNIFIIFHYDFFYF